MKREYREGKGNGLGTSDGCADGKPLLVEDTARGRPQDWLRLTRRAGSLAPRRRDLTRRTK